MSKISYKRLLNTRYSYLHRNLLSDEESEAIDAVLRMPHPQRETAFVELAQKNNNKVTLNYITSKSQKSINSTGNSLN